MKDYIGKNRWDNAPVKNKTQNKYIRFLRMPEGKLISKYWYEGDPIDCLKSIYFSENLK